MSPRFPRNMWTYERALALIKRKSPLPPLSLLTVAALLPQDWEFRLSDRNAEPTNEADWDWADIVLISAMSVQKTDCLALIREAKRRGKRVAVGGPYPTTLPDEVAAVGPDYLVLDEGELTIPSFVAALQRGDATGRFHAGGQFADLTQSPIPRFDLVDLSLYDSLSVQFSRGCPFQCEFCDVTAIYGRRARPKTPAQVLRELDRLVELGWNRHVFIVDDNFVGNRAKTRELLKELKPWMKRQRYPFFLETEASVDLASDEELLELMADCNFHGVFLGVETPDQASLNAAHKMQNTRLSLDTAVQKITQAGMRVMGGFIIGFDGEQAGAGERIREFVERNSIPTILFGMLQALPHTPLWHRLEQAGRLRGEDSRLNQETLMNFVPTRPIEEIAREYADTTWQLYDPRKFLDRTYRHFLMMGPPRWQPSERIPIEHGWTDIRALLTMCWRQGVIRRTRWKWWHHLISLGRRNPRLVSQYICTAAHIEHFLWYRKQMRKEINALLANAGMTPPSRQLKHSVDPLAA